MEPWKDMTDTATGTLLTVAMDITGGPIGTVRSAHGTLTSFAEATRMLRAATTPAEARNVADHVVMDDRAPSGVLNGAIIEFLRLSGLHMSVHPLTQTWTDHRCDTIDHSRDAGKKLSTAASMARAFENALRRVRQMTVALVPFSPTWTAWTSLIQRLAHDAVVTTALALHALRRMRDAVALEFDDASRIVNS
ncbi:hypothetical protein BS78_07G100500 [Paspalum vaginatum]|nr:hypothetical protein BS78_07G100500 [Paspalum vaginatum]